MPESSSSDKENQDVNTGEASESDDSFGDDLADQMCNLAAHGAQSSEHDVKHDSATAMNDAEEEQPRKRQRTSHLGVEANEVCEHSLVWGSICADCGAPVFASANAASESTGVTFQYVARGLEASQQHASALKAEQLAIARSRRKLLLVLDLDHTLLNSCQHAELFAEELNAIRQWYNNQIDGERNHHTNGDTEKDDKNHATCDCTRVHWIPNLFIYTKIRPFVDEFLYRASKLCDLYLFTMGSRVYAENMARLLDPHDQGLFGSRVISAHDNNGYYMKSLDIVVGQESSAVVIDDSAAVWAQHPENLLRIERYHFFSSSCRQFGIDETEALISRGHDEGMDAPPLDHLPASHPSEAGCVNGTSELQIQQSQRQQDDSSIRPTPLQAFLRMVECVHASYFQDLDAGYEADVRQLMQQARSHVLDGVRIVFSRMFPASCTAPESTNIWQEALSLGADCSMTVDSSTTHIVAGDSRTEKARDGRRVGAFIVSPRWLSLSAQRLVRMDEAPFLLPISASTVSDGTKQNNRAIAHAQEKER